MNDSEQIHCYKRIISGNDPDCYRKLAAVLIKVLQPNFKTPDTVLPKLIDLIKTLGNSKNADHKAMMQILLSEWLNKVCQGWSDICDAAKVLAFKVAAHVTSCPTGFTRLSSSGCLTVLLSHVQDEGAVTSNDINCGYLCLMESIVLGIEGFRLLLQSGAWKNVVKLALSSSNVYCLRQSTKLLAAMLMAADDNDSIKIFNEITQMCVSPHQISELSTVPKFARQNDCSSEDSKINTLNACRMIILCMMDRGHPVDKINYIIKSSDVSHWAWLLISNNRSKMVFDAANKLTCVLNALRFYQCRDEAGFVPFVASKDVIEVILSHFNLLINQQLYYEVLDAGADYQIYLYKYSALVAPEKECDTQGRIISDVTFSIHNLIMCYMFSPVVFCLKIRQHNAEVHILEEYIDKLFRVTDSNVIRHAYSYRDALFAQQKYKMPVLSIAVLRKFSSASHIIKKEQAIYAYQGIVHLIAEFVAKPEESVEVRSVFGVLTEEGEALLAKYPALLSAALNCLHCYLRKFDFPWRDSLESLSLMSSLQKLLDSAVVTQRITVEVLMLIDLVLQKFMPPNLALLVDTIKDSSIEDLGPQLFRLLHSSEWSVRDSALEVVKTICTLSESRFPAFQTLLIDCKLPEVVLSMIETDPEPFVRTSAISCLYELAKIANLWKTTVSDKNVVEKLLLILHSETEGIVRVAAAKTISVLHSQRTISSKDLELVYDVLVYATCNDLHWEVKVECLEFWKWVLIHSVMDQGMCWSLDFPEFVFSKEHKKIVKLTPEEISLRLSKTYKILGDVGCLQVMYHTFINEPDLVVQRKSAELHKMVSVVSTKWNVPQPTANPMRINQSSELTKSDVTEPDISDEMEVVSSHNTCDETIEQIISQKDVELLDGLLCPSGSDAKKTLPDFKRVVMSDVQFVSRMRGIDVEGVLQEKEKWVLNISNGVVSLLDDILMFMERVDSENQPFDRNAIDCY